MIIDTSIAISLLLETEHRDKIKALFANSLVNQVDILDLELANALASARQKGVATESKCAEAFEAWNELEIPSIATYWLVGEALNWSMKLKVRPNDMLHVLAATVHDDVLVTLDKKLIAKLKGTKFAKSVQFLT
jgi:predicted nucleic acid-binding protein